MIKPEDIEKLGGDWGQYGEVSGDVLVQLLASGKVSVVFADKGLMIGVQKEDGKSGVYNLKHTDVAAF